jgi:hypothetical protein
MNIKKEAAAKALFINFPPLDRQKAGNNIAAVLALNF